MTLMASILALIVISSDRFSTVSPRASELPPPTSGAPAPGAPRSSDGRSTHPRGIEGRVTSLDRATGALQMRGKNGQSLTLKLLPETTVFLDGRVGRLADVKPGDVVRSVFDVRKSGNVASWIEVEKKEN